MKPPHVSIIILNWNNFKDTLDCLKSLEKLTYQNFTIVVVDNASTDNSVSKILEKYPDVTIISNTLNAGFAGGNNIGIKYALDKGTDYIWLLNNDTVVHPNALNPLVDILKKDDSIAVAGSKIYFYEKPNVIWFAGGKINYNTAETDHIGGAQIDNGQFNMEKDVDYITGCSFFISSIIIKKIGLMNEEYFLYFEETDWCARIKNNGYRLVYVPNSIIYHKVSSSTGQNSVLFYYYFIRNRLYFLKKYGDKHKWLNRVIGDMKLLKHILKTEDNRAKKVLIFLRAYHDFLFNNMGKKSF